MNWRVVITIAACALSGSRAFARAGTGAANAQYQNPKTVKGLCTPDNEGEPYYKQGYCLSLAEQFNKNQCTKDALEEMRQRMLPEEERSKGPQKQPEKFKFFKYPFSCSSEDGKKGWPDILKDKNKFSYVMMQFMAMTTVQESGWDVLNKEQAGGKGPGGLLNLSLAKDGVKDMDAQEYACGCKERVTTTSGQSGVTVVGQSPGPLDGHHSQTCGSYMLLKQALKDGTLYGGNSKTKDPNDPKKDGRQGGSKLFASLESEPISNPPKEDAKQAWRDAKMATFCKRFWASSESKTNPWERQLTEDVGPGTKSSR